MRTPALVTMFALSVCAQLSAQDVRNVTEPSSMVTVEDCFIRSIDRASLAADRVGVLSGMYVVEGDHVEQGQLLAQMHDEVAQAALAVATKQASDDIEIRFGRASAEVADAEYRKALEANRVGGTRLPIIPSVEIDRLRLAATRGGLQTEKAQHDFEIAALERDRAYAELKTFRVQAPFSGTVINVFKRAGEGVSQGEPIVEIVNTDRLRVEGWIPVSEVWSVKPGNRVTVQLNIERANLDVEDAIFEGRIVFVDPDITEVIQNPRARVFAEVPNREGLLRPGLSATMTIYPGEAAVEQPAVE